MDEDPLFNGDIQKYLAEHIVYPQQAIKEGLEGTVVLQCTISAAGKLTDVQIRRGLGSGVH